MDNKEKKQHEPLFHIVKRDNLRIPRADMNQTDLPDPVQEDIDVLQRENVELINRVIDLEIRNKIVDYGQEVARVITENYGFAGKDYIKYIQTLGMDAIFERYKKINNEILEKTNSNKIATAHNSNDKVETILMNILRGSGTSGLKGIDPINGKIIRNY